jgi:hypothetical protein
MRRLFQHVIENLSRKYNKKEIVMSDQKMHRPERMKAERWAQQVGLQLKERVYPSSFIVLDDVTAFFARQGDKRSLCFAWKGTAPTWLASFQGNTAEIKLDDQALTCKQCPANETNAAAMRQVFAFTRPSLVGFKKSFGCGDRLGLATPGHVLAVAGRSIMPILAQQSIREMTRTHRSAQEVMDDACFAVFQAGFDLPFGSDADHLKNAADIDVCVKAGFLLFTLDPGEHVDDHADTDSMDTINSKFAALPWASLKTSTDELIKRYEKDHNLESVTLTITKENILRAAVKYGKAIAHVAGLYQHLLNVRGPGKFELEISVDETASPTTPQEHFYVASELKRLGVEWVSLAPRFIGRFEKGVDYIGDLNQFKKEYDLHARISRVLGPYKISIHSGSDKFSIYPIIAACSGDSIHVKTAGTSYLEALRVLAKLSPALFREILDFARSRYPEDKASYHVSADLNKVAASKDLSDAELPRLLDEFDAREVLHVTFGSVLTSMDASNKPRFHDRFMAALIEHEQAYHEGIKVHFDKHMSPFSAKQ